MDPEDFEWDPAKAESNFQKHGIAFENAIKAFDGPMLLALDLRQGYDEVRWRAIGLLDGLPIFIAYTEREGRTRIISVRKADHDETQAYFKAHEN